MLNIDPDVGKLPMAYSSEQSLSNYLFKCNNESPLERPRENIEQNIWLTVLVRYLKFEKIFQTNPGICVIERILYIK